MDSEIMDFLYKVKERLKIDFFLSVYSLIIKSKVCPNTNHREWLDILTYMHVKGWLYYAINNGSLETVIGAYRIKEFDESKVDVLPEKEEGDILYVPFAVSISRDKLNLNKMLKNYLEENPSVKEIVFYERNSDTKIKRFNLKGESNVEVQESVAA